MKALNGSNSWLPGSAFWRWHLVTLLTLLCSLVVLQIYPDIDFAVTNYWYDSSLHRFPLQRDPFWYGIMHEKMRKSMQLGELLSFIAVGLSFDWSHWSYDHLNSSARKFVMVVLWPFHKLWNFLRPLHERLKPHRRWLLLFFVSSLLAATIVHLMKKSSQRACPYDLTLYGGDVVFRPLLSGITELKNGYCWPGGHVLHAFTWIPIHFALRGAGYIRASRCAMVAVLLFGFVLNVTQIIRGAHFLSHNLWTLFACWAASAFMYALWERSSRKT